MRSIARIRVSNGSDPVPYLIDCRHLMVRALQLLVIPPSRTCRSAAANSPNKDVKSVDRSGPSPDEEADAVTMYSMEVDVAGLGNWDTGCWHHRE